MKLNEPRKLSHQESPVTQLKLLWRTGITEEDKDHWREQFESGQARKEVRQELFGLYQIELKQDVQLARFCRWVEEEDSRKSVYEDVLSDRQELEAQGVGDKDMDLELIRRMKERALARGDFKLGAMAIKLSVEMQKMAFQQKRTELQGERVQVAKERVEIAKQRLALQERKTAAVEKLTKPRKPVDYFRPLTDEERVAIVDKLDELMGLKSAPRPIEQVRPEAKAQPAVEMKTEPVAEAKEKAHEKKMEEQPGGLTEEVLEKIEEDLKLFPPYVIKDGKKVHFNRSIPGVTDKMQGDEDEDEDERGAKEERRETAEEFQRRMDEEEWAQWKKEKHF